jgi:hypothetical protein
MDKEIVSIIVTSIVAPSMLYSGKYLFDRITRKSEPDVVPPLHEHPFFERMNYLKSNIQMCFCIPNKGKEAVFRDLLTNKMDTFSSVMGELVQEIAPDMDDITVYNLIMRYFDKALISYSCYYKNSNYTVDEKKVLDIVMGKFNRWHQSRIDNTQKSIDMICNSQFYTTPTVRVSVVLDLLLGAFIETVNDAQITLNELNGDLKGLTYKGIKM